MHDDLKGTRKCTRRKIAIKGVRRVLSTLKEELRSLYPIADRASAQGEYANAITHYESIRRVSEIIAQVEAVLEHTGV